MNKLSRAQRKEKVRVEIAKREAFETEQKRLLLEKEKKEKKEALEEELRLRNLREEALLAMQPLINKLVMVTLYGPEKPPIPEKVKTTLLNGFKSFIQFTSNQRFTTFRCCA